MAHLIDKDLVERVNNALLLGILWAALATCVLGALAYDIGIGSTITKTIRIITNSPEDGQERRRVVRHPWSR